VSPLALGPLFINDEKDTYVPIRNRRFKKRRFCALIGAIREMRKRRRKRERERQKEKKTK